MGVGMVLIVDPSTVGAVRIACEQAGEVARIIGRVEEGSGIVRYNNEGGLFSGQAEQVAVKPPMHAPGK